MRQEEGTAKVGGQNAVPAFGSGFQKIEPGLGRDPRVVDPEVDSPKLSEGFLEQAKAAGEIGHVGLKGDRAQSAELHGLGTGALGRFSIGSVIHHDGKPKVPRVP